MSENQKEIKDRIGGYLIPRIENEYLFDELSDSYLEKAGIADILAGVPVPIKKTELEGLSTVNIARNMSFVISTVLPECSSSGFSAFTRTVTASAVWRTSESWALRAETSEASALPPRSD